MKNQQDDARTEARPRAPAITNKNHGWCIGCGKNNPYGLKLNFQWDGKTVRSEFTPNDFYQGWPKIVHGGIITTMLDEVMAGGYIARELYAGKCHFCTDMRQFFFDKGRYKAIIKPYDCYS